MRGLLLTAVIATAAAAEPLVVYDVTFSDQQPGQPVQPLDWDAWHAAQDGRGLPLRRPSAVRWVTPTRTATVVAEAAGMAQPVVFAWQDNEQPHYGPMLLCDIPERLRQEPARWRAALDVAKTGIAISGGVHLWDVCMLEWHEDGIVRNNGVEVARYAANRKQRYEFLVDVAARTVTVTVDGGKPAPTQEWCRPKGVFAGLRLHGLLPGGHCESPSGMVFDNIRIERLPAGR